MKRTILKGFEIPHDTHAALKRVAAQEDRTLAAQVRRVLNRWAADLDVRPCYMCDHLSASGLSSPCRICGPEHNRWKATPCDD